MGMITCIDCEATAMDTDPVTPPAGWGWVSRPDPYSASGYGPFLACPLHKNDAPYWTDVEEEGGEDGNTG